MQAGSRLAPQSVSALNFNFEQAVGGSNLTAGKKLSLKNLNVTIRAMVHTGQGKVREKIISQGQGKVSES